MTIKLISLLLENFQGAKRHQIDFAGRNASIYGDNATGKTTIANAFLWALCDKAYSAEPSFSPKPKDAAGADEHNLTTAVTVTIECDGVRTSLRREMSEIWKTKRGSVTAEFSGHENKYFIDGVPTPKASYLTFLADLFPTNVPADILLIPGQFNRYDRKTRRALLADMCGDISQDDVIASEPKLEPLRGLITENGKTYAVEDYLKLVQAQLKEANQRREQLPARIDEATRALPDIGDVKESALKKQIAAAESEYGALQMEIAAARNGDGVTKVVQSEIRRLERQIEDEKDAYERIRSNKTYGLFDLQQAKHQKEAAVNNARHEKMELESRLNVTKSCRTELVAKYRKAEAAEYNGDSICPTCGQQFPPDMIEESVKTFNLQKSQELERIRGELTEKASKVMIAELEESIAKAEAKTTAAQIEYKEALNACNELTDEINCYPKWEDTERCRELYAELFELNKKGSESADPVIADLESKAAAVKQKAFELRQKLLTVQSAKQQKKRIDELCQEQKTVSGECERLMMARDLCEQYKRTYANYVSDRINAMFNGISFRLFDTQINGGIVDDCEMMIPCDSGLVPYATANNAARINAGLALIDGICSHYGISLPVFVDNAESVSEIKPISGQLISLVVCGADKQLRVMLYG